MIVMLFAVSRVDVMGIYNQIYDVISLSADTPDGIFVTSAQCD